MYPIPPQWEAHVADGYAKLGMRVRRTVSWAWASVGDAWMRYRRYSRERPCGFCGAATRPFHQEPEIEGFSDRTVIFYECPRGHVTRV